MHDCSGIGLLIQQLDVFDASLSGNPDGRVKRSGPLLLAAIFLNHALIPVIPRDHSHSQLYTVVLVLVSYNCTIGAPHTNSPSWG